MVDFTVLQGEAAPEKKRTQRSIVIEVRITRARSKCQHDQITFCAEDRTCECDACGAHLDPFFVMERMYYSREEIHEREERLEKWEAQQRELEIKRRIELDQKRAERERKRAHFRHKCGNTWHRTALLRQRDVVAKCGLSGFRRDCEWSEQKPSNPLCAKCFGGGR